MLPNPSSSRMWTSCNADATSASGVGLFPVRNSDANDVDAGRDERSDLLQRRVDVGGLRRRHRLDADRRIATDRNASQLDLPGLPALDHADRQCLSKRHDPNTWNV